MPHPQLVALYDVTEDGTPVALVTSAEPGIVDAVAQIFADRLGVTTPARVLELAKRGHGDT